MSIGLQERASCVDGGSLVPEEIDSQAGRPARLLYWLLQHPFQSIEDIVLALGWHRASVYHGITKLEKQGMVESIHDPLSSTKARALYLLSGSGITIIENLLSVDANIIMANWRYREQDILDLLPRIHVQRLLQRVINSLVMGWEHTNHTGTRITWKWIHDYQPALMPTMKWQKGIADALIIFSEPCQTSMSSMQSQEVYQSLLLVIDPGFAGERDYDLIRQRIETLRSFYEALERWQPDRKYPLVFIVTPSTHNNAIWAQLLNETMGGQFPHTVSEAIVTSDYNGPLPLYAILPWKQISDNHFCDSMQMVLPSTHWELPPAELSLYPTGYASGADMKSALRGHFMQRSSRYEGLEYSGREAIGLFGLRLHRRHLDLLQAVYQYPLLSREEIAEILYVENDSVQRTLSELVRLGCVNVYHLPCDQRFSLGSRGIHFMSALLQVAPAMITEIYQGRDQRILQHGRRVQRGLITHVKWLLKTA